MYTNQSVDVRTPQIHDLACQHAPGAATLDTCAYLRALDRLRARVERASTEHRTGQSDRRLIGEFWLLHAEIATALDHCPDLAPVPVPLRRRTLWPPS